MQVEKTVFISYRRANMYHARSVHLELMHHGYDVFLDYESIDSGSFLQIILNQIAARAHFLIVLTPSALERCVNTDDWLRREIEYAIDHQRNIVPLLFDHFEYEKAQAFLAVSPKLQLLKDYSSLTIHDDYFPEAMGRLRNRYLDKPLEMILHPVPLTEKAAAAEQRQVAEATPAPTPEQLRAERYFEQGYVQYENELYDEAIDDLTYAILANPQFVEAFYQRGVVYQMLGDSKNAMKDWEESLRLAPKGHQANIVRSYIYFFQKDYASALAEANEAIRLNPTDPEVYRNRGIIWNAQENHEAAIVDYTEALRLNPQDARAYNNRGFARQNQGDLDGAVHDFRAALRINPNFRKARGNLKWALAEKEKKGSNN